MRTTRTIASLGTCLAAAGVFAVMAVGCTVNDSSPAPSESPSETLATPSASPTPTTQTAPQAATSPPTATPSAPPPATPDAAARQLEGLSLEQRVGQLFMVAAKATGPDPGTMEALGKYHVGNVYLSGRSKAGAAATANVVASMNATVSPATTGNLPLFVATDQEGGNVQVLSGPGFSAIPPAMAQAGLGPGKLRASAALWGRELRSAGVNVDLAPVLDTVKNADFAPSNGPIGRFQRQYGYEPGQVSVLGNAFAQGLNDAGVAPVVKHYPGLGRVVPNTDVSKNVRDSETTRTDPALGPFNEAIQSGAQWVMLSNAFYDRIDPANIAPFSPVVIESMLRGDAGFKGIILSDDLCSAAQLEPWSSADRAINFFGAGGTMMVCADPSRIPAMHEAVVSKAKLDPVFRAKVDAATLTVLQIKAGSKP